MGLRELSQSGGGMGLGRVPQESMGVSQHPSGEKEEELSIIPTVSVMWVDARPLDLMTDESLQWNDRGRGLIRMG